MSRSIMDSSPDRWTDDHRGISDVMLAKLTAAGVAAVQGWWSETNDYNDRRGTATIRFKGGRRWFRFEFRYGFAGTYRLYTGSGVRVIAEQSLDEFADACAALDHRTAGR